MQEYLGLKLVLYLLVFLLLPLEITSNPIKIVIFIYNFNGIGSVHLNLTCFFNSLSIGAIENLQSSPILLLLFNGKFWDSSNWTCLEQDFKISYKHISYVPKISPFDSHHYVKLYYICS